MNRLFLAAMLAQSLTSSGLPGFKGDKEMREDMINRKRRAAEAEARWQDRIRLDRIRDQAAQDKRERRRLRNIANEQKRSGK